MENGKLASDKNKRPPESRRALWSNEEDIRMSKEKIFTIPARRCKRCGGILTSQQGIRDGYGACCLRKMKQEQKEKEEQARLVSFFDLERQGRG